MSVFIQEEKKELWRGFSLRNQNVTFFIAPEIGGRILSMSHQGEELFYIQHEHRGEVFHFSESADMSELRSKKKEIGFRLWGGDKTWLAPQDRWAEGIPPLDLDAAPYRAAFTQNSITLTSNPCRESGLTLTRKIESLPNDEILLTQTIYNHSDRPAEWGIWNVTQMLRPFDVYVYANIKDFHSCPEVGESQKLFTELVGSYHSSWVNISFKHPVQYKFGGFCSSASLLNQNLHEDDSMILAVRYYDRAGEISSEWMSVKSNSLSLDFYNEDKGETLVHYRKFKSSKALPYAHQASVEFYNSPDHSYWELETHAPLLTLLPKAKDTHSQIWGTVRLKGKLTPDQIIKKLNI